MVEMLTAPRPGSFTTAYHKVDGLSNVYGSVDADEQASNLKANMYACHFACTGTPLAVIPELGDCIEQGRCTAD